MEIFDDEVKWKRYHVFPIIRNNAFPFPNISFLIRIRTSMEERYIQNLS